MDKSVTSLPGNKSMRRYTVELVTVEADELDFECWADDTDDAIEQAESAYPGCEISGCNSMWSGSPCPIDPENFWIDDDTGERVNTKTGERTAGTTRRR